MVEELTPPLNVTLITDFPHLEKLYQFFQKTKEAQVPQLGWDIETTLVKDFYFRRCRTVQFGDYNEQYVIDLLSFSDNDPELLFQCQGNYGKKLTPKMKELMDFMKPILDSRDYLKVGVNLGFEYMTFYWNFGMRTWNYYDCMMAEKCIWAGAHSMKDYGFYSMDEMVQRYFQTQIDKSQQKSFTLDGELTKSQIDYGALDTRFPLSLKAVQAIVASGKKLQNIGPKLHKYFDTLEPKNGFGEPIVMGDDLNEIIQIENDAIGMFEDMHIHGENLDKVRWKNRVAKSRAELKSLISDTLDPIFKPVVGSKFDNASDEEIANAEALWKSYNIVSNEEIALRGSIRVAKKVGDIEQMASLQAMMNSLEEKRKATKEIYKTAASDMKKQRTKIKNLAAKCEGEALINYSSDAQILAVIKTFKGLANVKSLDDELLEAYENKGYAVMGAIRKLHGLSKEIGTYGDQWATEWTTKPCKEEGWLNPGDGRLHCVYNQYDAETGRSSSEKPNGQNLPQDTEVRSCFVADPPNENIRVSNCCDADTVEKFNSGMGGFLCSACNTLCETHAEEYVIITADMSGAELRIIAELANDPVWCEAFNRGEDVHSVGTEILHEDNWTNKTYNGQMLFSKKLQVEVPYFCEYYKLHTEESLLKNPKATLGEPMRQKCECPEHKILRDENKSTNFLLAYGGGPHTLMKRIKKTLDKAQELMALHAAKFPRIWAYLELSGKNARMLKKSFDMFGRRRLFPDPTWERAKALFKADNEVMLRIEETDAASKLALFEQYHNRKPDEAEEWELTHRQPTSKEIGKTMGGLASSIERQGKNHAIQGTNASIIKLAGGCGFDKDDKPYLWHVFPLFRAILLKMVHDELVVQSPKHKAKEVAAAIGDAFKRAAATKMKKVFMEFDFNIKPYWSKG